MTHGSRHTRRYGRYAPIFIAALVVTLLALLAGCSTIEKLRGDVAINPDVRKGIALLDTNDVAGAVTLFDRAIKQNPHDPSIYLQVASGCDSRRHWDLTAQYAEQGITNTPKASIEDRAKLYNLAGMAYMQKGDSAKAVDLYEAVLRLAPDNAIALNNLGYALADTYDVDMPGGPQQLERALTLTTRAVQIARDSPQSPPESVADFLDSVAWAQYKLHRYNEAIANLRRAIDAHPESPEINYHLGMAYEKVGRYQDAALEFDRTLRIQPDYNPALIAKEKLPVIPPPPAPAGKKTGASTTAAPSGAAPAPEKGSAPSAAGPAKTGAPAASSLPGDEKP